MLIEVSAHEYTRYFPNNPHPFISNDFIELNAWKTERILRLVNEGNKKEMGLVAGLQNSVLKSPFSAPFGGFHFRNELFYSDEIDIFLNSLKEYIINQDLSGIDITLPPDIYNATVNAKLINSLVRNNYTFRIPDITCWVDLRKFNYVFNHKSSNEFYRQALRNFLNFKIVTTDYDKEQVYDLIYKNRSRFGRPIFMTLDDILDMTSIWPVDFFKVSDRNGIALASAIFYRSHPSIAYAVFWGDNEVGRPLRAMDFLSFNLWKYYKDLDYRMIDLGTSTENGIPNVGLLRFKETHNGISSLRHSFFFRNPAAI